MDYETRPATNLDEAWLYDLYCLIMRTHIEQTWGWDEAFQMNVFKTNLCPDKFKLVVIDGSRVGAYLVNDESDHHWLEMMLIVPEWQRKGIGREVLHRLQINASEENKPLKLCVIKVNPVLEFYTHLGFKVFDEDESLIKLVWGND